MANSLSHNDQYILIKGLNYTVSNHLLTLRSTSTRWLSSTCFIILLIAVYLLLHWKQANVSSSSSKSSPWECRLRMCLVISCWLLCVVLQSLQTSSSLHKPEFLRKVFMALYRDISFSSLASSILL